MENQKATDSSVEATREATVERAEAKAVDEWLSIGKRHFACGEYSEAADYFEKACTKLTSTRQQFDTELAEPYFLYGKALLEIGRQETGVLGTGVPTEADDSESSDGDSDEEEGDEASPKERNYHGEPSNLMPKSSGTKEGSVVEESMEAEEQGTCTEQVSPPVAEKSEDPEENVSESNKPKADERKDNPQSDVSGGLAGTDDKERVQGECGSDKTPTSSADTKEDSIGVKSMEAEEQGIRTEPVSPPVAENSEDSEENVSESDKPTADEEGGLSGESSGKEGQDEAGLDGSDDVPDLQLAWETLELSRVIYERDGKDKNALRLASIHILLGEINVESDNQESAAEDFRKALAIRLAHLPDTDRSIAECHFELGLSHTFAKNFDQAVEAYEFAKSVLKKKLESVKASDTNDAKEIEELQEIISDVDLKIEDVLEMRKMDLSQKMRGEGGETSVGFDAPKLNADQQPTMISFRKGQAKSPVLGSKRPSKESRDAESGTVDQSSPKRLKLAKGNDKDRVTEPVAEGMPEQ